jgi:acyl-lipid omega-6 desaturase (Delta-12 desaturase)
VNQIESIPSAWRQVVERYSRPSTRAAVVQLCNTILPLIGIFALMTWALRIHYGLVLLLSIPAAGLLVRAFIVMHDCGHGSFFKSRRWNDIVGFVTGVMTLTPYVYWRREHAIHHANAGNLDHRGWGDITTLTVREYLSRNWWGRLRYRVYRNPLVLFGIGPVWLIAKHRLPRLDGSMGFREHKNVILTNVVLIGLALVAGLLGVLDEAALIFVPSFLLAGAAGVWLFYVQHQFEEAYWRPGSDWSYEHAALQGSTYLKLPKVLQWFTGNIGLHHIHHLSPRIPNYRLQQCYDEQPMFQRVPTITLGQGLKAMWLKLFDEDSGRLVGFRHLRNLHRGGTTPQGATAA